LRARLSMWRRIGNSLLSHDRQGVVCPQNG
jgi:hypothetical protein